MPASIPRMRPPINAPHDSCEGAEHFTAGLPWYSIPRRDAWIRASRHQDSPRAGGSGNSICARFSYRLEGADLSAGLLRLRSSEIVQVETDFALFLLV
jgi:hypothetical protein